MAEWQLPWYAWRARRKIRIRQRTVLADIRYYEKTAETGWLPPVTSPFGSPL